MGCSTSQVVHLLGEYGPMDDAPWPPHGYCMGEQRLVPLWCSFRGVGCPLYLADELRGWDRGRTFPFHISCSSPITKILHTTTRKPDQCGLRVWYPVL